MKQHKSLLAVCEIEYPTDIRGEFDSQFKETFAFYGFYVRFLKSGPCFSSSSISLKAFARIFASNDSKKSSTVISPFSFYSIPLANP